MNNIFVNYVLVEEGFAEAARYEPDTACATTFNTAELSADRNEVGMWNPTSTPRPTSPPSPGGGGSGGGNCHPSYPTVCIAPPPPDLDCKDIPYRRVKVLKPGVHGFDGDNDGIGCESG